MTGGRSDYPPLLPPGLWGMSLDRLGDLVVAPFRRPARRFHLLNRFRALVSVLREMEVPIELWLDGSFVTCKPEPEDIDVVVLAEAKALKTLSPGQRTALRRLFQDSAATRSRYGCHAFFVAMDDDKLRDDWRAFFGRARNGQKRGLIVCRI